MLYIRAVLLCARKSVIPPDSLFVFSFFGLGEAAAVADLVGAPLGLFGLSLALLLLSGSMVVVVVMLSLSGGASRPSAAASVLIVIIGGHPETKVRRCNQV